MNKWWFRQASWERANRKGRRSLTIYVLLMLLVWIQICPANHAAAEGEAHEETTAALSGAGTVTAGQSFDVTYSLDAVTDSVYAQDLTLTYDAEKLEFIAAASLQEGFQIINQKTSAGSIRLLMASEGADYAVHGQHDLLKLSWKAKSVSEPADTSVTLSSLIVANGVGKEQTVDSVAHNVRIVPKGSGRDGDLNGDDKVSVGDLAIVAAAFGKTSKDPDWALYESADLNRDGRVDVADLAMIAKWMLSGQPDPVEAPQAVLSGRESVKIGQTFDVTYGLKNVTQSVYAQDLTFTYSPQELSFISAESLQDDFRILEQEPVPNGIRILAYSVQPQDQELPSLLKLQWKVLPGTSASNASIAVSGVIADAAGAETNLIGATHSTSIQPVDITALLALITEAQSKHDAAVEGGSAGQYPAGSKAQLQTAIDKARDVMDSPETSQELADQAVAELQAALQSFLASVNASSPGDSNNDGHYSIGDLAIAVKFFGKTSADPEWISGQKADLNNNGTIDLPDLAAIAQMILQ